MSPDLINPAPPLIDAAIGHLLLARSFAGVNEAEYRLHIHKANAFVAALQSVAQQDGIAELMTEKPWSSSLGCSYSYPDAEPDASARVAEAAEAFSRELAGANKRISRLTASAMEAVNLDEVEDKDSTTPGYSSEVQAYAERVEKAATEAHPLAPFRSLCARSRALIGLLRRVLSRIAHARAGRKSPARPGSEPRECLRPEPM